MNRYRSRLRGAVTGLIGTFGAVRCREGEQDDRGDVRAPGPVTRLPGYPSMFLEAASRSTRSVMLDVLSAECRPVLCFRQ